MLTLFVHSSIVRPTCPIAICVLELVALRVEAMAADMTIERPDTVVTFGSRRWSFQTCMVGDVECVELNPNDRGLVLMVAAEAGLDCRRLGKSRPQPSLSNADGFIALKEIRDKAQAMELEGGGSTQATPKKSMFDDEVKVTPKKKRRMSMQVLSERRESPELFTMMVDGMPVVAQRPILSRDKLIVKLETESLVNAIKFIVSKGVTDECLLKKRQYGAHGKGVWSFHRARYFYKKTPEGYQRTTATDGDEVREESKDADGDGELDVDVEGAGELEAAIDEGASEAEASEHGQHEADNQDTAEAQHSARCRAHAVD